MDGSMQEMQKSYWDRLSEKYQRMTEISPVDFHYGPQIPGESVLGILPNLAPGARVLELGTGGGQNSVYLAKKGFSVHGCDISQKQVSFALNLAAENGVKADFRCLPIERFHEVFDGKFDLIHSSHAFEFVDNPSSVVKRAAEMLSDGGMLLVSTVHPLFNGEWVENIDEDGNPDGMGLFLKNYFSPPDDVRYRYGKVDVISRAYPVSSWFGWFRDANLEVTVLLEPASLPEGDTPPYTSRDWADNEGELDAIPGTIIIGGVRPGK